MIGGGSAGLTATTIAARAGARVLLVDRERLGGDCLHYGCVPSKALIASARMAHRMRHADRYGLPRAEVRPDVRAVMERIRRVQDEVGRHDSPEALERMGATVRFGGARFLDSHTLQIGDEARVTADRVIIATGSHAVAPPVRGLAEAGYIDHVGLFSIENLPEQLVVIGGGPLGCEMGQALSRLGSEVTIVQRGPHLLPREDPEVSQCLEEAFLGEGIGILTSTTPLEVAKAGEKKRVVVDHGDKQVTLECDAILVAAGRRPTLDELELDAAGVEKTTSGIVVDDALRTSQKHIFAMGDCAGGPQFTHWAEYEARIAARNALFLGSGRRSTRVIPWVTFTDPEVARVGLTYEEARAKPGLDGVHQHRVALERVDRAVCESHTTGFIKVVVDGREGVLGAHIVGAEAGEALAEWVLAMGHGIPLNDVGAAIHAYPTWGRVNRRVADERFFEHGVSKWAIRFLARFKMRTSNQEDS